MNHRLCNLSETQFRFCPIPIFSPKPELVPEVVLLPTMTAAELLPIGCAFVTLHSCDPP